MNGLNHINYLFAAGTKLAKNAVGVGGILQHTTDYCGSFVYEDGELQYLLTSEGRVVFNLDGTHEYQYFLKDHLGNTRVTFGEDGIIQEDSYYPFGMLERSGNPAIAGTMAGLSQQNGQDLPNKYLYNAEKPEISDFIVFRASSKNHKKQSFLIFRDGKELQDDFGLDWYGYGARFYNPVIGKWHMVDPLSENYTNCSPYNFALNYPLRYVDPDGALPEDVTRMAEFYLGTWYEYGGKRPYYIGGHGVGSFDAWLISQMASYSINKLGGLRTNFTKKLNKIDPSYKIHDKTYFVKAVDIYKINSVEVPNGYSMGIDCSGLAKLAFNNDPDKLMRDLPDGVIWQRDRFAKAAFRGLGELHGDFNRLIQGDLVFTHNTSWHVMVATGQVKLDKDGNVVEYEVIQAPDHGLKVERVWKDVIGGEEIGHTYRKKWAELKMQNVRAHNAASIGNRYKGSFQEALDTVRNF